MKKEMAQPDGPAPPAAPAAPQPDEVTYIVGETDKDRAIWEPNPNRAPGRRSDASAPRYEIVRATERPYALFDSYSGIGKLGLTTEEFEKYRFDEEGGEVPLPAIQHIINEMKESTT